MACPSATHNRRGRRATRRARPCAVKAASGALSGGMLLGALGEETATSAHPRRTTRVIRARIASLGTLALLASALAACGGGERQDANEPSGKFPVDVSAAKFPTDQRLAETSDLELTIQNTGNQQIPDLAVTINTGDEGSSGPFSVRLDQPGLADPNRPVWILESGYPKLRTDGESSNKLDAAPTAGAAAAQTNTFSFGPLAPNESKDIVWRVTPVVAGTYTVHYQLAAGLTGKAQAVTESGGRVEGEFVVTIDDKPPRARVDDSGNVVIQEK